MCAQNVTGFPRIVARENETKLQQAGSSFLDFIKLAALNSPFGATYQGLKPYIPSGHVQGTPNVDPPMPVNAESMERPANLPPATKSGSLSSETAGLDHSEGSNSEYIEWGALMGGDDVMF